MYSFLVIITPSKAPALVTRGVENTVSEKNVTPTNVQIFEDPPINDYQVKGTVFGTSLDKVEKDNIYMPYEGKHNSLPSVVSS